MVLSNTIQPCFHLIQIVVIRFMAKQALHHERVVQRANTSGQSPTVWQESTSDSRGQCNNERHSGSIAFRMLMDASIIPVGVAKIVHLIGRP